MLHRAPSRRARARRAFPAALLACALAAPGCGDGAREEPLGEPRAVPDADRAFDPGEAERLKALGYVDAAGALGADDAVGVLLRDPSRSAPGVTLVTDALSCRATLYEHDGTALRQWSHEPCHRWGNSVLTPGGDLLVVGRVPHDDAPEAAREARYVMRLAWDGRIVWKSSLAAHHDVEATPGGRVATLLYALRVIDQVHPEIPTRDHEVALLDAEDGELVERVSLWRILNSNPDVFRLRPVAPREFDGKLEVDLFHSNAIEWMRSPELAAEHPLYSLDNVLLCLRHQDAIVIVDWPRREVVWAWGPDVISGPHDATVLANGNVLLFDNGLGRDWSRVLEVDPRTGEIVWEYHSEPPAEFYTRTRGANQRLANGNTLITESDDAIVFEVTPEGEEVWRFRNPDLSPEREPGVLVRARRYFGASGEEIERLAREGAVPWVD